MGNTIAVVLAIAPWFGQQSAGGSAVKFSYEAPRQLVLHEPVVVSFSVANLTAEPIHLDLGLDRTQAFTVTVRLPDGSIGTPRLTYSGPVRIGRLSIPGNGSYSQQILLNQWLLFDQIGAYQIEIQLSAPIETETATQVATTAKYAFDINVRPRDERTLRQTCQRLALAAASGRNFQERGQAAHALSYMADPVAIPCFRSVLGATDAFDGLILRALQRTPHPEARLLLEEIALSDKEDRSSMARSVLDRIGPK